MKNKSKKMPLLCTTNQAQKEILKIIKNLKLKPIQQTEKRYGKKNTKRLLSETFFTETIFSDLINTYKKFSQTSYIKEKEKRTEFILLKLYFLFNQEKYDQEIAENNRKKTAA